MAVEWYYQTGDKILGPVDGEHLKNLAQRGAIRPDTLLRPGKEGKWAPARKAKGLFDNVAASPAPSLMPAEDFRDLAQAHNDDRILEHPGDGGRILVTAFGVVTMVLASVLTLTGCASGVGAIFCFTASSALRTEGQKTLEKVDGNGNDVAGPAVAPSLGCLGAFEQLFGAILWIFSVFLAVVMAINLIFAGGHFTLGVGVIRRRPWSRILALVLSVFTGCSGLLALYEVVYRLFQNPGPTGSEIGGQALVAGVGLLFLFHAALSWVVMFHPACSQQFQR